MGVRGRILSGVNPHLRTFPPAPSPPLPPLPRLMKIKEWVDSHDPQATVIPFSGALELRVSVWCVREGGRECMCGVVWCGESVRARKQPNVDDML